jgi:hypothetical protein
LTAAGPFGEYLYIAIGRYLWIWKTGRPA